MTVQIAIEQLRVGKQNVRKSVDAQSESFRDMVASIRKDQAVHVALKVRATADKTKDGKPIFDVVWGQRRMLAAREAGLKRLPCDSVAESTTDGELMRLSALENLHREDLSSEDKGRLVEDLLALEENGKRPYETERKVAEFLNVSPQRVSAWRAHTMLPEEVRDAAKDKRLKTRATEVIAQGVKDPEDKKAAARAAMYAGEDAASQEASTKRTRAVIQKERREKGPAPKVERITKQQRDDVKALLSEVGKENLHKSVDALEDKDVAGLEGLRLEAVGIREEARKLEEEAARPKRKPNKDAIAAAGEMKMTNVALEAFAKNAKRVFLVIERKKGADVEVGIEPGDALYEAILQRAMDFAKANAPVKELADLEPEDVLTDVHETVDSHGKREEGERIKAR